MNLAFDRPEVLAAAALCGLFVVLLGVVGRRGFPSVTRLVLDTAVRCIALLLLGAALAGPYLPYVTTTEMESLYVVDRSASISAAGRNRQGGQFAALSREGPAREAPFGDVRQSDPRGALLRAGGDPAERVVIATDGFLTADAAALIADVAADGRTVGVLPVSAGDGDPALSPDEPAVILPGEMKSDEPVAIVVRAPNAETVTLFVDGRQVGDVGVVSDRAEFPELELEAGRREIVAVARAADGARRAVAVTARVTGPLPVLILGADEEDPVARALLTEGFDVSVGADIDVSNARVIVALPSAPLPEDGGPLPAWVRGGGGLLVATGIPPGLSRYRGTPAADLLPAVAEAAKPEKAEPPPPEEEPDKPDPGSSPTEVDKEAVTLSLLIVIDRSGSMVGIKIRMAQEACYQTATALDPKDRLGVIAFNEESQWIHPFGEASNLGDLRRSLMRLQAGGGTDIFGAMKMAGAAMKEEESAIRHIILVSDGQDAISGFASLIRKLRAVKITVTTVGVGRDYEPRLLGKIAEWGGGNFWDATDPSKLPRVITMDARRVLKIRKPPDKPSEDLTTGAPDAEPVKDKPEAEPPAPPVKVRATSALPLTAELDFPALKEVEPVTARFPALTALVTEEGNPALLLWRYGAGRVALIPADPADWVTWPDFGVFLGRLVNQISGAEPTPDNPPPLVRMGRGRVVVSSLLPPTLLTVEIAGEEVKVPLSRTGPDRWEGELPEVPAGTLLTARVRRDDGAEGIAATVAPPPAETLVRGIEEDEIVRLARAAGRPAGEIPPPPEPDHRPGKEPIELPLLIAAILLLPVDVAVRRLGR